jgi:hypothetical protein
MIPFALLVLSVMIASALTFILGSHLGFQRGYEDGFGDASETEYQADLADLRWILAESCVHCPSTDCPSSITSKARYTPQLPAALSTP